MKTIDLRSFAVKTTAAKRVRFALISLALGCAGIASAQSAAPTKFCVLQAEAALVSTKDGQTAVAELQKILDPKKTDLEKKQSAIKDKQDQLAKGGNTMSQTAKDNLTREIDTMNKTFTREVEDYNAEAENQQRKVMDQLSARMKQVLDLYAKDHGCMVVFNIADQNTPIVYFSDTADITAGVVEMYDKTQASPAKPGAAKPTSVVPPATKPPAATGAPSQTPPATAPAKKQP
jgi:Skp family chaperone for outer membrane proteins